MEMNKVLENGTRLKVPYHESMNIDITDFDVESLANNATGKINNSIKITKFLSKQNLTLRALNPTSKDILITYKGNSEKGLVEVIGGDREEISLQDTVITLSVDEDRKMHVQVVCNEEIVTEEEVEEITTQNEVLQQEVHDLNKRYHEALDQNHELQSTKDNTNSNLNKVLNENKELKDRITEIEEVFDDSKKKNNDLKKRYQDLCDKYELDEDILNEYKEDVPAEMLNTLQHVQDELNSVESQIKDYLVKRQTKIDEIRRKTQAK